MHKRTGGPERRAAKSAAGRPSARGRPCELTITHTLESENAPRASATSGYFSSRELNVLLQQRARHHHALDLVRALIDLGDLGVAHHPFNREVLRVAGAAEQLHGVGGDLHRDIG